MDRTTSLLMSIIILISCSYTAYAASSLEVFALNPTTMECGEFWAGDEFSKYTLPEGWSTYHVDTEPEEGTCIEGTEGCRGYQCKLNDMPEPYCWGSKLLCENVRCEGHAVITDVGTCYITGSAETCCAQLGYTYISDNIGEREFYLKGKWRNIMFNHPEIIVLAIFAFIAFIYLKRRYRMKR